MEDPVADRHDRDRLAAGRATPSTCCRKATSIAHCPRPNVRSTTSSSPGPTSCRPSGARAVQQGIRHRRRFARAGKGRHLGAVVGSFFTLLVTLLLSFPIGVATAIYLEEFAPRNRWTDLIEVNINNLAAVPSIVFGLLGLAVFIDFFGLPRSAPLVGGVVLTLMTLPTIIIASAPR